MAQIPMTPGRSRMPGTPNLGFSGGFVTPEDMGTRQFQEYGRLAQAIGHAGQELQQWQIRKYNEKAEADSLVETDGNMRLRGEELNRVMTLKGSEAANALQMYQDYAKKIDDDALGRLKTPLSKEIYRRRMLDYDRHASQSIDAYTLQEGERYRQTALSANIEQEIKNAAQNAGNGVAFVDAVQHIRGYTNELYRGQPPEFIDLQNQKYASLAIDNTARALAEGDGPQAALNFLDSGVEELLDDKNLKTKFGMLRKKYQGDVAKGAEKQAVDAGTIAVTSIIDNGGSLGDAYVDLIRLYGSDVANQIMTNAGKYKGYVEEAAKKAKDEADTREKAKAADDKEVQEAVKRMGEKAGIAIQEMARNMKAAGFTNEEIENRIRVIRPEMVKQGMAAADDAEKTRKADITATELQRKQRLEDEFNRAGGIATNMPSFSEMGIEERSKYLKMGEEYEKLTAGPKKDPSLDTYLELVNLSDDELNNRWADVSQRDSDIAKMGGMGTQWSKAHIDRIDALAKFKREQGRQAKEKPPEMATLDTELNNIKRDIDLNIADTGRSLSKDERAVTVDRVLNQYTELLNQYMTEKGLEKVTQVPVEQRKRMRAESLLTYQTTIPGYIYDSTATMTKAEADAAGISTEGAAIVPQSLPVDLRQNYLGGTVRRIAQAHSDPAIVNVDVPVSAVPENVRIATESVGGNPMIYRELVSGGYMVIGSDRALEFGSKGIGAREMTKAQADAFRRVAGNEYDPMALTDAEQARLRDDNISVLAGF